MDFPLPGGMRTMSRRHSPRSTSSRWPINSRWCAAGTKPSAAYSMYDVRLVWAFFRASNSERSKCGEDFGGTEFSDIPADPDVGACLRLAPGAVEQGLCRPDAGRVRRRAVAHYGGERGDRL